LELITNTKVGPEVRLHIVRWIFKKIWVSAVKGSLDVLLFFLISGDNVSFSDLWLTLFVLYGIGLAFS
jgi:hypothetical protein